MTLRGVALAVATLAVLGILGLFGYRMAKQTGLISETLAGVGGGPARINYSGQIVAIKQREAPGFSLTLFNGEKLNLSELKGKPVVLNFWASWCPPCRAEAPLLERTWRTYKDKGLVFVGIDVWDSEKDARKFISGFGISYPNGPDPWGEISIEYGLAGIPETFFINKEGKIVRKFIGPFTPQALTTFIEEILQ